jgi:uncharacterized protein YkwD
MKFKAAWLVILSLPCLGLSPATPAHAASWQDQMLKSLNSIRVDGKVAPLTFCRPLTTASQKYANILARQDFLAHEGKDGSTPGKRMQSAGYRWMNTPTGSMVAENIAAGQNSVSAVMKSWRDSTGHYKNMVEPRFTHVGFGMAINPNSKYKKYWVQNFGYGATC